MEKNNKNHSNKVEYQPVYRAEDFFEKIAEQKKSDFLSFALNKIYSNLLKFIESVVGIKLYVSRQEQKFLNFSPKTKRLMTNLVQKNIIKRVIKMPRTYHDEPKIIQYQSETFSAFPEVSLHSDGRGTSSKYGGGADFNEKKALMKAIGEGVERLCLAVYREKNCFLSSYDKISKKALNPLSFAGISAGQRSNNKRLRIDEKSIFRWVRGFSLFDKKEVFIPAQLVYIGYKYHPQEPVIQQQLSTGAAAADSFEEALYKGVCEAVERDAFMITYFNELSPPLIELENINDRELQKLLSMFKRYNLELYVADMTTDIAIPSIMAIIIDRSGIGPVIHIGTKTSLNIKNTILGVIGEALRGKLGSRKRLSLVGSSKEKIKSLRANPSQIRSFTDRTLFWNSLDMIDKVEFLFQGKNKKFSEEELDRYKNTPIKEKLKIALNFLRQRNVEAYGVDITMPQIKEEGIYVAKVVSPQLQPLYLSEYLKSLSGDRLFQVPVILGYREKPLSENELNPLPHPFL